ncbi:MAG: Sb-PDE family phosphodiesterase [Opitutaceae bacterium]
MTRFAASLRSSARMFAVTSLWGCAVALSAAADRTITFPDIAGYRTLKTDFHQHTVFSDGKVWPHVRVEESVRDGLDALAITDHLEWQPHSRDLPNPDRNRAFEIAKLAASFPPGLSEGDYWLIEQYMRGREDLVKAQDTLVARPKGAEQEAKAQSILVVPGVEITRNMPLGHVGALFIADANRLLDADPLVVLREAAKQGAFLVWNHPWSLNRGKGVDGVARNTELHSRLFDEKLVQGIEVVNTDTYSEEALQIALDRNLTIVGTSDIHGLIDWTYPAPEKHRPVTLVFAKEKTLPSLREALVERRTVVWFNNTLIGRADWIDPLLKACLTVRPVGYKPDRRKYSIQERPDTSLLDVEIVNSSDAMFILRSTGPFKVSTEGEVFTVGPHSSLKLTVLTVKRIPETELSFEVLNTTVAPRQHATATWILKTN